MAELAVPPEGDETQKPLGFEDPNEGVKSLGFDIGYEPPIVREPYKNAKPKGYEEHRRASRRVADQSRKRNRRSR
jgi:hypothetical protein